VRLCTVIALLVTFGAGTAACSDHSSAQGPNTAAYLTIVKSPTIGSLADQSDQVLLGYGNHACADLNAGERSDAVVADLSGDALPGSAAFNSYSMVTAAAAKELCPQHAADFAADPNTLTP
jgi:Protein of unknown function (DUF732)